MCKKAAWSVRWHDQLPKFAMGEQSYQKLQQEDLQIAIQTMRQQSQPKPSGLQEVQIRKISLIDNSAHQSSQKNQLAYFHMHFDKCHPSS